MHYKTAMPVYTPRVGVVAARLGTRVINLDRCTVTLSLSFKINVPLKKNT